MTSTALHYAGFDGDQRQRRNRLAAGVAVSLALHALLLFAYRAGLVRPATDETPEPRTIAVWLRPPAPPAAAPAEQALVPPVRARPPKQAAPSRKRHIIAVAPAHREPSPISVQSQAPQAVTEKDAPHFDMEAAKGFARRIANDRDPAKAGTALERLPEKPLQTESKAARAISSAYRPLCKDGVPGGLLAPIYLMMDKKDSGCRW